MDGEREFFTLFCYDISFNVSLVSCVSVRPARFSRYALSLRRVSQYTVSHRLLGNPACLVSTIVK